MFTFRMRTTPTTDKSHQTRRRIARAAQALFARQGYEATTVRDIAGEAGCALGLVYRYFETREQIVLFLYGELQQALQQVVEGLPQGTIAERSTRLLRARLDLLDAQRETFRALTAAALSPRSGAEVLSDATAPIRHEALGMFVDVVRGAADAPADPLPVARVIYAVHLLIVLAWTQDRTPRARATRDLADALEALLAVAMPMASAPPAAEALARLSELFKPFIDPTTTPQSKGAKP